ncbi:MAG: hypothetical protein P4L16_07650 [Chlamydiales bacterium]|nr:hypothetical protein [Chlamydiales bacterium]
MVKAEKNKKALNIKASKKGAKSLKQKDLKNTDGGKTWGWNNQGEWNNGVLVSDA